MVLLRWVTLTSERFRDRQLVIILPATITILNYFLLAGGRGEPAQRKTRCLEYVKTGEKSNSNMSIRSTKESTDSESEESSGTKNRVAIKPGVRGETLSLASQPSQSVSVHRRHVIDPTTLPLTRS